MKIYHNHHNLWNSHIVCDKTIDILYSFINFIWTCIIVVNDYLMVLGPWNDKPRLQPNTLVRYVMLGPFFYRSMQYAYQIWYTYFTLFYTVCGQCTFNQYYQLPSLFHRHKIYYTGGGHEFVINTYDMITLKFNRQWLTFNHLNNFLVMTVVLHFYSILI